MAGDIFGCHNWEGGGHVLLSSSGSRPGMLSNILARTEQPPSENDAAPDVNSAEGEEPWLT